MTFEDWFVSSGLDAGEQAMADAKAGWEAAISTSATSAVPAPDLWKVIDRGEHLLTEAMEIPGRGVLVRCSSGAAVSMIHLPDVRLEGSDVSWRLV